MTPQNGEFVFKHKQYNWNSNINCECVQMYINKYKALKRKVPLNVQRNLYRFLDLRVREIQEA